MLSSATDDYEYDIVISGMGPGGMASAYEAAKQGKKVLIVSDREPDFVRVQRIYLEPDYREYLLAMLNHPKNQILDDADLKFKKNLAESHAICIKDIEAFIKRRLDYFSNPPITYMYPMQISQIDMEKGEVSIQSVPKKDTKEEKIETVQIRFTEYLVGADGANHHAATVFNKGNKSPIEYKEVSAPNHQYHFVMYVTLEREDGKDLLFPQKQFLSTATQNDQYLCAISASLDSYEKSNRKSIKLNFSGEIPAQIYEAKDFKDETQAKNMLVKYAETVLNEYLRNENLNNGKLKVEIVKPSKKHPQKDKLKFQVFPMKLEEANKAAVKQKRTFILVGDAFRKPDYQIGHGINDAFQHALWFAKVLNGKISIEKYDKNCHEVSRQVVSVTNYFKSQNKKSLSKQLEKKAIENLQSYQKRGVKRKTA